MISSPNSALAAIRCRPWSPPSMGSQRSNGRPSGLMSSEALLTSILVSVGRGPPAGSDHGEGRRRWFSKDDKAQIIEETLDQARSFPRLPGNAGCRPTSITLRWQARRLPLPMADDRDFWPRTQDSATQSQAGCPGSPLPWRRHRDRSRRRHDPGWLRRRLGDDCAIVHALKASR